VSFIIGRGREDLGDRPAGRFGTFRALDGSEGAPLYVDLDRPHAMLVVGKRGYGKSYTMGVLAEELARSRAVAPVVVDPMGIFETFTETADGEAVPAEVVATPTVRPDALDPRSWCALVGLAPDSGAGALVWGAAQAASTIDGMVQHVSTVDADGDDKRAARNHIELARSWGIFDADGGLDAAALSGSEISVIDVSGLDTAPMNAVVRGVAESLYRARVSDETSRLPWLLLDEAHVFFESVAEPALETILTRGRAPGVSIVLATQRPSAVPEVGISQADVLVSHRLTSQADIEALRAAQPTYMSESLEDRMPTAPGEVIIVDDSTETVHAAQIRKRDTPHGGDSVTATEVLQNPGNDV
jgi:DNA helicase HerA-like ATPase